MGQWLQLCYIPVMLVGVSGLSMQIMLRTKNLSVKDKFIQCGDATVFLTIVVMFDICEFLTIFLRSAPLEWGIRWISAGENLLELVLACAMIRMERKYAGADAEGAGGFRPITFFAAVGVITFLTDAAYNGGLLVLSFSWYIAVTVCLHAVPAAAVVYFGCKYFRMAEFGSGGPAKICYIAYSLFFLLLCTVTAMKMPALSASGEYLWNCTQFYAVFWLLLNIMNLAVVWNSCGSAAEGNAEEHGESALERFARLAEEYKLSEREVEIARMLCNGRNNNDIASALYLSPNTVKVHTSNLYRKLGVKNRVQAVQVLRGEDTEL